jgi:small conductance mechanosensitive channel
MNDVITRINEYLSENIQPEQILSALARIGQIILIFIMVKLLLQFLYTIIDKGFSKPKESDFFDTKKVSTLSALLKSILRYVIYFIAFWTILKIVGFPTESILAAAGIGGLAIGFGAQSLVRDIIVGFFIIFEDHFSVGEYVTIVGLSGIVEEMGLRVTKIRDFSGELHIIPNGSIGQVTNHSRGPMRALVRVSIAYEEDIDRAMAVIEEACLKIKEEMPEDIVDGPRPLGVAELADSGVTILVFARTKSMLQWSTERLIRKRIKEEFARRGIEIPYPKRVIINPKGKDVAIQ